MSKQTGQHPDERQEPLRVGKKPRRDRPWMYQERGSERRRLKSMRWKNWWTVGLYETRELAEVVMRKRERDFCADMWERRIVHRDELP